MTEDGMNDDDDDHHHHYDDDDDDDDDDATEQKVPQPQKKMARTLWNRIIERVLLLECVNRAKTRTTSTNDIDTTRNITGIHDRMNQQG